MKLKSLSYKELEGTDREWSVDNLSFQDINLIVGKNATGKSRCINVINAMTETLLGKRTLSDGFFKLQFLDSDVLVDYDVQISQNVILTESLIRSDTTKPLLTRDRSGYGEIFYEKAGKYLEFQLADNQLTSVLKQDSIQHPFLLPLREWADGAFYYPFGSDMGKNNLGVMLDGVDIPLDLHNPMLVVGVLRRGIKNYGDSFKNNIINDMKCIGYELDDIYLGKPHSVISAMISANIHVDPDSICVKETGLPASVDQILMSQGMFRALATIIQLTYGYMSTNASFVMIDDIGEGLDFDRSTALIKLIIERARSSGIQIIMATNDRFVMNNVPLEYWSVLHREGNHVEVFNNSNSKERFEEFKFTGLNNFDAFSSDFLVGEH